MSPASRTRRLDEDNSRYVGTWHYPGGGAPYSAEDIVYTRVEDDR